jgi:hypothetical protein
MLNGLMPLRNLAMCGEETVENLLVSRKHIITRDVDFRGDGQKCWVFLTSNM